jgi:hypothetical protein
MTDPKFIGPPKKLFQSYTMPKAKTATEIGKDIMKKTNVGAGKVLTALGSPIRTTKKILAGAKAKFTGAAKKVKAISKGNIGGTTKPLIGKSAKAGLGKQNRLIALLKKTPTKARLASKALRVAKFARAATPIGLATVAVTSIKKRDPKAVKRERDFYKGKKYKDVGFESMLNYNKGGLKMATKKLKAQGYNGGDIVSFKTFAKNKLAAARNRQVGPTEERKIESRLKKDYLKMIRGAQIGPTEEARLTKTMKMKSGKLAIRDFLRSKFKSQDRVMNKGKQGATPGAVFMQLKKMGLFKEGNMANLKKIPEGPEGEGLRKLKAKRPDVTRKMGFAKKGKVMKAMAGKSVRGFGAARTSGMGLQDEQMVPGKSMDYYKDLM